MFLSRDDETCFFKRRRLQSMGRVVVSPKMRIKQVWACFGGAFYRAHSWGSAEEQEDEKRAKSNDKIVTIIAIIDRKKRTKQRSGELNIYEHTNEWFLVLFAFLAASSYTPCLGINSYPSRHYHSCWSISSESVRLPKHDNQGSLLFQLLLAGWICSANSLTIEWNMKAITTARANTRGFHVLNEYAKPVAFAYSLERTRIETRSAFAGFNFSLFKWREMTRISPDTSVAMNTSFCRTYSNRSSLLKEFDDLSFPSRRGLNRLWFEVSCMCDWVKGDWVVQADKHKDQQQKTNRVELSNSLRMMGLLQAVYFTSINNYNY